MYTVIIITNHKPSPYKSYNNSCVARAVVRALMEMGIQAKIARLNR